MTPHVDFGKSQARFGRVMREYSLMSSKTVAEAINKKAKDVCLRAIRETPVADKGGIEASLRRGGLAHRLIRKKGLKRKEIERKAAALIRARKASVGYIRAGFYKAAQVFGGGGGKTKPGGLAVRGSGKKATPSTLKATITNGARGAVPVAGDALAKAMDEVAKDMLIYIAKKLRAGWGKSS